ncbi:hypothetical protein ABS198_21315, partial [Acinetobacter baumannii]|uniref:hypothetical protein n=1 Tax=Acinetobacter baumannii TaxID=470 RepID=UPI00332CFABA
RRGRAGVPAVARRSRNWRRPAMAGRQHGRGGPSGRPASAGWGAVGSCTKLASDKAPTVAGSHVGDQWRYPSQPVCPACGECPDE